jgi:hypothetical protein
MHRRCAPTGRLAAFQPDIEAFSQSLDVEIGLETHLLYSPSEVIVLIARK